MAIIDLLKGAAEASREMALVSVDTINTVILAVADRTLETKEQILSANAKDLAKKDINDPMHDRLKLTSERIDAIVADMRNVVGLPAPQGRVLNSFVRDNGMKISKVAVPFGVIGVIYEARPNVSFDLFSLCFKSGNACLLKGGSDAHNSNTQIVSIIRDVLQEQGINPNVVTLLPAQREATSEMLEAVDYVDVIIPRGSRSLIEFVRDNSRVPVIETGAGICHTYFDKDGDIEIGAAVINNAKTRRVSVCNALDCLIINSERLSDLPRLCEKLAQSNVVIYADERAYAALAGHYDQSLLKQSDDSSYGTEFLSYAMSIKTVYSLAQAVNHITQYSSKHSEAIVSENKDALHLFNMSVDAACVYNNLPTSFTDGAQFGFGAEVGISTQKLHARGPMALPELTSYKYIIEGEGQIRP
ncbi:MAG: glutamate-5-semialdehyde dehydrogenase [Rikenellaceae bacterium]